MNILDKQCDPRKVPAHCINRILKIINLVQLPGFKVV